MSCLVHTFVDLCVCVCVFINSTPKPRMYLNHQGIRISDISLSWGQPISFFFLEKIPNTRRLASLSARKASESGGCRTRPLETSGCRPRLTHKWNKLESSIVPSSWYKSNEKVYMESRAHHHKVSWKTFESRFFIQNLWWVSQACLLAALQQNLVRNNDKDSGACVSNSSIPCIQKTR